MKYLKYTAAFFAPFVVLYLCGSFVAASFDITQWDKEGRFLTVLFSAILGFGSLGVAYAHDYD